MNRLLPLFLLTLASHGLEPTTLDPWRGWLAFKEFARAVNEVPDPGVSVQFTRTTERGERCLVFVRQTVHNESGRLTPTGGVVCELDFPPVRHPAASWDRWSFDYSSFDRFVDIVEQEPVFQDLMATRALRSRVYWEPA